MKISFKFKDGLIFTQELEEFEKAFSSQEAGKNVLGYFINGKQNNSTLTINDGKQEIVRKYEDLSSVEFIF